MSDLDSLRTEVREAVEQIDRYGKSFAGNEEFQTIRAELIRLQGERDAWRQEAIDCHISEFETPRNTREMIVAQLEREVAERVALVKVEG